MRDLPTTISLIILTILSMVATVRAFQRLRTAPATSKTHDFLIPLVALGAAALFLYRWWVVRGTLQPLGSHVDGLLLITALLAAGVFYLDGRSRLPGVAAFALPAITLVLAWSICASSWTYEPFKIDSAWTALHLAGVYVGTIFLVVGAVAGGMYLFAQHRLRDKRNLAGGGTELASLEAIERTIVHATAVGFALLSIGLIAGLIVVQSSPNSLGPGWWYSPKVLLAVAAWTVYALVLNVRHATLFRGARAAWLSICGIVLMMATFGVVNAIDLHRDPLRQTRPATRVPTAPTTRPSESP